MINKASDAVTMHITGGRPLLTNTAPIGHTYGGSVIYDSSGKKYEEEGLSSM